MVLRDSTEDAGAKAAPGCGPLTLKQIFRLGHRSAAPRSTSSKLLVQDLSQHCQHRAALLVQGQKEKVSLSNKVANQRKRKELMPAQKTKPPKYKQGACQMLASGKGSCKTLAQREDLGSCPSLAPTPSFQAAPTAWQTPESQALCGSKFRDKRIKLIALFRTALVAEKRDEFAHNPTLFAGPRPSPSPRVPHTHHLRGRKSHGSVTVLAQGRIRPEGRRGGQIGSLESRGGLET